MARRPRVEHVRPFSIPINEGFVSFAKALNFELTEGQTALCEVAFDGKAPKTELHERLFGPVHEVPELARGVVCFICGARGGKTRMCACRALHLALTVPIDKLGAGELGFVLVMGPKIDHAEQAFRYIMGFIEESHGAITAKSQKQREVTVVRHDGEVRIICMPADARGAGGRGKTLLGAVLDEFAFFRDSRHVVNDADIFKAVSPRVLPEGQVLIATTPWADSGLAFDIYQGNFGKPSFALVAHAPTLLLNPSKEPEIIRERLRDPENAEREFEARFGAGETTHYFPPQALLASQVEDPDQPWPRPYVRGNRYAAAADLGFKRDSATLVIVEFDGEKYRDALILERKPEKSNPMAFDQTMDAFAAKLEEYHIKTLMADQYHRQAVLSAMGKRGINVLDAPSGGPGTKDMCARLRRLLSDGKVEFNFGRLGAAIGQENLTRKLVRQLKEIRFKMLSGGDIALEIVRRGGSHGDIAIGYLEGIWSLYNLNIIKDDTSPEPFSPDWYSKRLQKEQEEMRRAALRRAGRDEDGGWADGDSAWED